VSTHAIAAALPFTADQEAGAGVDGFWDPFCESLAPETG